jgi:Secretion system C-terminal sorting domain
MKNFTLFALCAFLFTTNALFAQPTAAPTAPTKAAADVISILSNTYTPVLPSVDFNPNWGQTTVFSEFPLAGNPIKKYAALTYQGIAFNGDINASGMTTLHWDIWTDVATTLRISLIANGAGERFAERTTVVGWNSFDIPLTEYTSQAGFSVSNIFQFKFEEFPRAAGAGTKTVYLYNLYFWKPANVPTITGFTVPAKVMGNPPFTLTAPTSNSMGAFSYTSSNTGVATISGNTVTITGAGTSTITANQAAAGGFTVGSTTATLVVTSPGPSTAAPTPTKLAANVTSLFSNAYTNVAVDTWSTSWDVADVEDVMIVGNATKKYTNHTFSGIEFTGANMINATTKTHIHMDVWTADAAGADGFKVKLVDFGADGAFGGGDDAVSIELPFTPTASGWFAVDAPLSSFTGLTTKAHLAQLILVTPGGGKTFWLDNVYLYNEPATAPMVAAPTPTKLAANVTSLFSNAYTNVGVDTWSTSWDVADVEDVMIVGNATKKYTNHTFSGIEFTGANMINATTKTHIHMDVWTADAAGADGFKVKLVDFGADGGFGGGDDAVSIELPFTPTASGWFAVDAPLSSFTGLTTKAHLAQLILVTPGGGKTFWLDNVYLYNNPAIPVEMVSFKAKMVNNTTILNWQTASERDNQGFTIERSTNGTNYTAIGQVKGNGTTNAVNNYTFTDNTPSVGSNYYRLRQTDMSGKETLSSVVSVLFGKTGLLVKNTLAHDALELTVGGDLSTPLSIFNVSGQEVYNQKVQGSQTINISHLATGLYIIRTGTGDVSKFVKN